VANLSVAIAFAKDYLTTGHEGERYYFQRYLQEVGPREQDKAFAGKTPVRQNSYLGKLAELRSEILVEQPSRVLEIGVKHGFSTFTILSALKRDGVLVSIDRNRSTPLGQPVGHVVPTKARAPWTLMIGDALELLGSMGDFDFIYEDRGKCPKSNLLEVLWSHLNPGGTLFIGSRVVNEEFDSFAISKGDWTKKNPSDDPAISAWATLKKSQA